MTKITYIPGEIANAAIDEHGNRKPVTRTQHIFDDAKGKSQAEVNADVDDSLADRYTKAETYNKSELNNMITTPDQEYETYNATDQTTDVTDVLPATGAADTVYRVGNWDGSQFDTSVYSEYAWNGSSYVHLNTKTQIGEVFDISAYHATGGTLATYADLSVALDSNNGGGVPQSLQKGGMSVKFVQTSDNKYVQYRLMSQNWSTTVSDWVNVEEELSKVTETLNYFHINDDSVGIYGVTIQNNDDGTFTLNGTEIGTYNIPITTLPAGTYTAYFWPVGGTANVSSPVSLRTPSGSWVSDGTARKTLTFDSPTDIIFRINNNAVFNNRRLKIVILKGNTINFDYFQNKTATDVIARSKQIDSVKDLNLFKIEDIGAILVNENEGIIKINRDSSMTSPIIKTVLILQPGTYTALFQYISGSLSPEGTFISVRYGDDVRWVDSNHPKITMNFSEETSVYLRINGNLTATDYRVRIVIVEGTDIDESYWPKNTAIDYVARNNKNAYQLKIGVIGDSITQGVVGGTPPNLVFAENPWPTIFKDTLIERNIDATVLNFGRRGLSAKSYWEEALPANSSWHNPHSGEPGDNLTFDNAEVNPINDSTLDAVIIMLGTNGSLATTDIETARTTIESATAGMTYPYTINDGDAQNVKNIKAYCNIIECIMKHTLNHAQIILVAPVYSTEEDHESKMIHTLPTLQALGERYQVPVINALYESGLGKFNYTVFYSTDEIHLNQDGLKKLGTFMASRFLSYSSKWA